MFLESGKTGAKQLAGLFSAPGYWIVSGDLQPNSSRLGN